MSHCVFKRAVPVKGSKENWARDWRYKSHVQYPPKVLGQGEGGEKT